MSKNICLQRISLTQKPFAGAGENIGGWGWGLGWGRLAAEVT